MVARQRETSRCLQEFRGYGRKIRDEESREPAQPLKCSSCECEDEDMASVLMGKASAAECL